MQQRTTVSPGPKHLGLLLIALPFMLAGAASAGSGPAGTVPAEGATARPQTERRDRARRRPLRDAAFRLERFAERLELTEEQRDQLRAVLRENRDGRRESAREIAAARRSLQEAVRDPERPDTEIRELGEALGRARADGILRARAGRKRIATILTEEQRARIGALRDRGHRSRRFDRERRRFSRWRFGRDRARPPGETR